MKGTICEIDKCTACGACLNICPKACISYVQDRVGHLYPRIDREKCIDCHACERVCQVNQPLELQTPLTVYAGWHKIQSDYITSTSGGAATAFSQYIISEGGVVYGCAWRENLDVEHVRIDSIKDIYRLKGSKYVQSAISSTIFKSVKADLNSGLKVLFIGTPCQVAGLKSYLKRDFPNLFLVDLICHGVPSAAILKKHVKKITGTLDNISVSFRDDAGMSLKIKKNNRLIYNKHLWLQRYEDAYYNSFIDGYIYRDSCYTCYYATEQRVSDITKGDFWGLGADFTVQHEHGCSCILPITQKGMMLVRKSSLNLFERSLKEAVEGNTQLREPFSRNKRINIFRFLISFMGFRNAYLLTNLDYILVIVRCKLKIGTRIKTLWNKKWEK